MGSGMNRNPVRLAIAAVLLCIACGCSGAVIGRWRMVEVVPNREVFSIDRAEFRRDGTFKASAVIDGKKLDESGEYEFTGFKLILRPAAGGVRRFDALLRLNRLEVTQGNRKVVLAKE